MAQTGLYTPATEIVGIRHGFVFNKKKDLAIYTTNNEEVLW